MFYVVNEMTGQVFSAHSQRAVAEQNVSDGLSVIEDAVVYKSLDRVSYVNNQLVLKSERQIKRMTPIERLGVKVARLEQKVRELTQQNTS